MPLTICIETGNDAFQPDARPECQRLLTQLALRVSRSNPDGDAGTIMDANGNTVGTWVFSNDDE
jgi:hypothetical protein